MKLRPYHIIICILVIFHHVRTEAQSKDITGILINLYNRILFTPNDSEKLRLNDSIVLVIDSYAASDSVFKHRFSNLRFLGQVISPDSRIKLITWNLVLRTGSNKYFCYIIRKQGKGSSNRVFRLMGEHHASAPLTNKTYFQNDWYGALYYAVQPCKKDYILLGLDFSNIRSRKIIEVLGFDNNGEIILGRDFFNRDGTRKFREVIEYSSESVVSLRFSNAKLIVFDNLASFSSGDENQSSSYGAGLSFDGYSYKKGAWKFVSSVDVKNRK